jgi:uncharacterized membrane protein YfcA
MRERLANANASERIQRYDKNRALVVLCVTAFVVTYWLLRRRRTRRFDIWASFLPLAVPGSVIAFLFPPETPHSGILVWTFGYCVTSLLTIFLHLRREGYDYLDNHALSFEGRLERLKGYRLHVATDYCLRGGRLFGVCYFSDFSGLEY